MSLTVFTEFAQLAPHNDKEVMLFRFKAPNVKYKPSGRNICFILDASGSSDMTKNLFALKELLLRMTDEDKICVISSATKATVLCDWSVCTNKCKRNILDRMIVLKSSGSSNLSSALFKCIEKLSEAIKNPSIFLISDGRANRGVTDHNRLCEMLLNMSPVPIYTIGVGNYNKEMLLDISTKCNGRHIHYSEDNLNDFYTDILGDSHTLAYQNLNLELCSSDIHFFDLNGDPVVDFNIGDIYANEVKDWGFTCLFVKKANSYKINYVLTGTDVFEKKSYGHIDTIEIVRGDDQTKSGEITPKIEEPEEFTLFDGLYSPIHSPF
jgi:hypothetical protein